MTRDTDDSETRALRATSRMVAVLVRSWSRIGCLCFSDVAPAQIRDPSCHAENRFRSANSGSQTSHDIGLVGKDVPGHATADPGACLPLQSLWGRD